jgi:hypothetical protein
MRVLPFPASAATGSRISIAAGPSPNVCSRSANCDDASSPCYVCRSSTWSWRSQATRSLRSTRLCSAFKHGSTDAAAEPLDLHFFQSRLRGTHWATRLPACGTCQRYLPSEAFLYRGRDVSVR